MIFKKIIIVVFALILLHLIVLLSYVPTLFSAEIVNNQIDYNSLKSELFSGMVFSGLASAYVLFYVCKKFFSKNNLIQSVLIGLAIFVVISYLESVTLDSVNSLYLAGESYSRTFESILPHFVVPMIIMFFLIFHSMKNRNS